MSSEDRASIRLLDETADTVTLRRTDFDGLLEELEDAEDRIAALEYRLAVAKGEASPGLTPDEVERLLTGEHPVKVWRQKLGLSQRDLAAKAKVSQSHLAEIEGGQKTPSVETLRKLAQQLKVGLDALVP